MAASIEAIRMIATIAILATTRDGVVPAGTTPVDRMAWSNPVGVSLKEARRRVAAAKPEGERGRDRR